MKRRGNCKNLIQICVYQDFFLSSLLVSCKNYYLKNGYIKSSNDFNEETFNKLDLSNIHIYTHVTFISTRAYPFVYELVGIKIAFPHKYHVSPIM